MRLYNFLLKSNFYNKLSSLVIVVYTISLVFLSLPEYQDSRIKDLVLTSFGILFTLEYVSKIICTLAARKSLSWTKSFLGIIDLIAILSFCLSFVVHYNFLFLRILRIVKVLSIQKDNALAEALSALISVLNNKKQDLMASFVLLFVLMIIASCAIYCFEYPAQPEKFSSVIHSFWWAIITMTTVGYGDVYPVTVGGKVVASLFSMIGFGFVALPAAIVSTGYIKYRSSETCEKCGHINNSGGKDV